MPDDARPSPAPPRKGWRRDAIWGLAGFAIAFFTFLAMTAAVTAGMDVLRNRGPLRPLPRLFQPAYDLSRDAVLTAVGGAFIAPLLLVPVLTAARVRFWVGLLIGFGIGGVLTAGLCAVGFCFWELVVMLPIWWFAGGVMGGALSGIRRRCHI